MEVGEGPQDGHHVLETVLGEVDPAVVPGVAFALGEGHCPVDTRNLDVAVLEKFYLAGFFDVAVAEAFVGDFAVELQAEVASEDSFLSAVETVEHQHAVVSVGVELRLAFSDSLLRRQESKLEDVTLILSLRF